MVQYHICLTASAVPLSLVLTTPSLVSLLSWDLKPSREGLNKGNTRERNCKVWFVVYTRVNEQFCIWLGALYRCQLYVATVIAVLEKITLVLNATPSLSDRSHVCLFEWYRWAVSRKKLKPRRSFSRRKKSWSLLSASWTRSDSSATRSTKGYTVTVFYGVWPQVCSKASACQPSTPLLSCTWCMLTVASPRCSFYFWWNLSHFSKLLFARTDSALFVWCFWTRFLFSFSVLQNSGREFISLELHTRFFDCCDSFGHDSVCVPSAVFLLNFD